MDGGEIIRHYHQILIRHLPRQEPALQHVQGSLIATHIGEVGVELQQNREEKARVVDLGKSKGFTNVLGKKPTYLLLMFQVV